MTDTFIHHHTASPYSGTEEDGFDVIETDEISIWQGSLQVEFGFASVAEAIENADEMARKFDRVNDPDGAIWLKQQFEHEWCAECGRDHRHHTAVPFMANWFARCDREPIIVTKDGKEELQVNPEGYEDENID